MSAGPSRHITVHLLREVTEYATVSVAVPAKWDAGKTQLEMERAAWDLEDLADNWTAEGASGAVIDSIHGGGRPTHYAAGSGTLLEYVPSPNPPGEGDWVTVWTVRWATDGHMLLREGAPPPRTWRPWMGDGRDRPLFDTVPASIAQLLTDSEDRTEAASKEGVAPSDGRPVLLLDGPCGEVTLDLELLPKDLEGLVFLVGDPLSSVRVSRDGVLEYLIMPRRPGF